MYVHACNSFHAPGKVRCQADKKGEAEQGKATNDPQSIQPLAIQFPFVPFRSVEIKSRSGSTRNSMTDSSFLAEVKNRSSCASITRGVPVCAKAQLSHFKSSTLWPVMLQQIVNTPQDHWLTLLVWTSWIDLLKLVLFADRGSMICQIAGNGSREGRCHEFCCSGREQRWRFWHILHHEVHLYRLVWQWWQLWSSAFFWRQWRDVKLLQIREAFAEKKWTGRSGLGSR